MSVSAQAAAARLKTIWLEPSGDVSIIDQRQLPHRLVFETVATAGDMVEAIRHMHVRGAPLIGVSAAYGMYLAYREALRENRPAWPQEAAALLRATRPTAVNLAWGVDRQLREAGGASSPEERLERSLQTARAIEAEDVESCRLIGVHGLELVRRAWERRGAGDRQPVRVLTHCNAGWLACVSHGTATSPIYAAREAGIPIHVWVDETRPRNQGASLTAWELGQAGVPHTVIADNAGGHLMQHGLVDLVIVGADRVSRCGDVANKIGTYLKALAAHDNAVPFYVALPSSTVDWTLCDGVGEIPIEERDPEEVRFIRGLHEERPVSVLLTPQSSPAANYAFDVTPARLVTELITERGRCQATEEGILGLFPERKR